MLQLARALRSEINESALLLACRRRSLEMMRTVLVAGEDPDAVDRDFTTSLHYAALHGFTEGVDLLLQFECSPDIENYFYSTPLIYAASRNYFDIVRHIIEYDASTLYHETEDHNTALLIALKQKHFALVHYLIEAGDASIDRSSEFDAGLYLVWSVNYPELVEDLLFHGANAGYFNMPTNDYVVENAIEFKRIENVTLLMAWGAKSYAGDDAICEPIRISPYNLDYHMFLALVATGAVVDLAEQQYNEDSKDDDYDDDFA